MTQWMCTSCVCWLRALTGMCAQCRDKWIASLVEDLDEGDSHEYVKHLTDIYRLHLFDAVMQVGQRSLRRRARWHRATCHTTAP